MKYVDADKIRAEIKRMISANKTKNGFPKGSFCAVRIESYNEVLGLLDTLEEPVSEDLEQEWLRYVDKEKKEYGGDLPSLGEYGWLQIARHFAEWQKAKMMEGAVEGTACFVDLQENSDEILYSVTYPKGEGPHSIADKVKMVIL